MLEGSLETFALPAVLRLVRDSGATGRLSIMAPLGTGSLLLEDGRVVDAQPAPGADVIEGALSLFEHRSGTFSFRNEPVTDHTIQLDVEELLKLVHERAVAWAKIREVIPDGPLAVVPDRRRDAAVTVSADAWRVAVMAGGKTPAQLAAATSLSEFKASSILLGLVEDGLIVSVGTGANGTVLRAPAVEAFTDEDEVGEAAEDLPLVVEEPEETDVDPSLLLRELGEDAPPARAGRRRR